MAKQTCNRTADVMTLEPIPESLSYTEAMWTDRPNLRLKQPRTGHAVVTVPVTMVPEPGTCTKVSINP